MLFPKRSDWKSISTAATLGASYSLAIPRQYWLESILLRLSFTTPATVTTLSANGIWNMLKRVRMSVADANGNRKVVDCPGHSLLDYWRQTVSGLDRLTSATAPGTAGVGAPSTAYTIYYPIPFRHPQLGDPFGAATCIPLARLNQDPVLEIDIASASDATYQGVAATFASVTSFTIDALINYRDILVPNFPYIAGELITHEKVWAASGRSDYEVPAVGTITGILQQDQTSVTARGSVLTAAATDDWSLEYLNSIIRRSQPAMMLAENEQTMSLYPATWNNPQGVFHWDFLTDYAGQDAFSIGSGLDVNPTALAGGKARIIGSNITGGANVRSFFTIQKLYGDLRAVKFV